MFDEFTSFLHQPNRQLVDVLHSPNLMPTLRAEVAEVFNYFQQDNVIQELAEWSFTKKFFPKQTHENVDPVSFAEREAQFFSTAEIAVNVLINLTLNLVDFLLENEGFSNVLHTFLQSDDSTDPHLCGNFTRILSAQIRWGTPALFVRYKDVQQLLINRVDIFAIQEFISLLILSNQDLINIEEVICELGNLADVENNENAQSLLVSTFFSCHADTGLLNIFEKPCIINNLVNAAIKCKSLILQNDIMDCLAKLHIDPKIIESEEALKQLTITKTNITNLSIAAIGVLKMSLTDLFSLFFAKSLNNEKNNEKSDPKVTKNFEDEDDLNSSPHFSEDSSLSCDEYQSDDDDDDKSDKNYKNEKKEMSDDEDIIGEINCETQDDNENNETKNCQYRIPVSESHIIEYLHSKLIKKVECSEIKDIIEIANTSGFLSQLIDCFGTKQWCPHCTRIVVLLIQVQDMCRPLKSKMWRSFIQNKFSPVLRILDNEYGGRSPIIYEDEASYSDVGDEQHDIIQNFEEEEDFYDLILWPEEEEEEEMTEKDIPPNEVEEIEDDGGELDIDI